MKFKSSLSPRPPLKDDVVRKVDHLKKESSSRVDPAMEEWSAFLSRFQTFPQSKKIAPFTAEKIGNRYSTLASSLISPVWLGMEKVLSNFEDPGPTPLPVQPLRLFEPPPQKRRSNGILVELP